MILVWETTLAQAWFPFVLMVLVHIFFCYFYKKVIDLLPMVRATFVRYVFCWFLVIGFWLAFDGNPFPLAVFLAVGLGIGLLNFIGVLCEWTAFRVNMSRTALFLPLVSLVSAALFCIFLGEYQNLRPVALLGFCLHLAAIYLFYLGKTKHRPKEAKTFRNWMWLTVTLIAANSLIYFFLKIASVNVFSTYFLVSWYSGMLLFSFSAFVVGREPKKEEVKEFNRTWFLVPVVSLLTVLYLASQYWAFQKNPGINATAFTALDSAFTPVVVGWLFAGEGKNLSKTEIAGFLCGIAAVMLIVSAH